MNTDMLVAIPFVLMFIMTTIFGYIMYHQQLMLRACLPDKGPYTTLFRIRKASESNLKLEDFTSSRPFVVTTAKSLFSYPIITQCTPVVSVIGNICAGKSELLEALTKSTGWPAIPEAIKEWKNDRGHDWFEEYNSNKEVHGLGFQLKIAQTQTQTYAQMQYDIVNGVIPTPSAVFSERSTIDALIVFADVITRTANTPTSPVEQNATIRGLSKSAKVQLLARLMYQSGAGWAPSIAVFVDADPNLCFRRKVKRNRMSEESINLDYLHKLDKRYRDYAELLRNAGVTVITIKNEGESLQDFLKPENVSTLVDKVMDELHSL